MTRLLLLLLKATWRYLLVAGLLLVALASADLGREAWTEATHRREAVTALKVEQAAARAELGDAEAQAQAAKTQRRSLHERLLEESTSALAGESKAVQAALGLKQAALDAARREQAEVERRVLGAAQGAVARAQESKRQACRDAGFVACNLAKLALHLRLNELESTQEAAREQLEAARRHADAVGADVMRLRADLERIQRAWADPLGPERKAALAAADAEVAKAEALRASLADAIERSGVEQAGLEAAQGTADRVLATWQEKRAWILLSALGILLSPLLWRTSWYFGLMGLTERARPIRLVPPDAPGTAIAEPPVPRLTLEVPPGDVLRVRSGYVARREGTPDTELVFGGLQHPFSSLASGLVGLDRFRPTGAPWHVTLGDDEPDTQLLVLRLEDHPGFVIQPAHVVAILGQPTVLRRWRLGHLHAWMTWQFRYLMFQGTGAVVLAGLGHLEGEVGHGLAAGVTSARVLGFDGRLAYRTARTRPFLPYLVGTRPLTEDLFEGEHLFVSGKVGAGGARKDPLQQLLSTVFGVVEKALGIG
jgi:hypothetical protein